MKVRCLIAVVSVVCAACPRDNEGGQMDPLLSSGPLAEGDGKLSVEGDLIARFPGGVVETFLVEPPSALTELAESDAGLDCVLGPCGGAVLDSGYAFVTSLAGIRRTAVPGGSSDWGLSFDFREGRLERVPGGIAVIGGVLDPYHTPLHLISTTGTTPALVDVGTDSLADMDAEGTLLFAVNSSGELVVVDVAILSSSSTLARIPMPMPDGYSPTWELGARGVAVDGENLFVLTAGPPPGSLAGLHHCRLGWYRVDLGSSLVELVDEFDIDGGDCVSIEVAGEFVVVAADGGVEVFEPGGEELERVRRFGVRGSATDIVVDVLRGLLAVSTRDELLIYDLGRVTSGEAVWP